MSRLALPLVVLAAVVALAYAPAPEAPPLLSDRPLAPADTEWVWPENPENLQVLPDDIGAEGLRNVMRSFTQALGVRCSHCHVGEGDFLNWDFASDANAHKEVARQMMRMTRQINRDFLADIDGLHTPVDADDPATWGVTCWTCHRGDPEPQTRRPPDPAPTPAPADTTHDAREAPAQGGDAGGERGRTHQHRDGSEHRHDD